jgi:hypothetical protein
MEIIVKTVTKPDVITSRENSFLLLHSYKDLKEIEILGFADSPKAIRKLVNTTLEMFGAKRSYIQARGWDEGTAFISGLDTICIAVDNRPIGWKGFRHEDLVDMVRKPHPRLAELLSSAPPPSVITKEIAATIQDLRDLFKSESNASRRPYRPELKEPASA